VLAVVAGPLVLIVRVEGCPVLLVIETEAGSKVHVGDGVTTGVIALQESVTVPVYPLIGLTVTTAVAPLPACTLEGVTIVVIVSVYSGVTARAVRFTVAWWVVVGPVPVTVTVYSAGGVVPTVEIVSVGLAGVVTEAGLTTQVGVPVTCCGATEHVSDTSTPLTEFSVPSVRFDVEGCPPGRTDGGEGGEAVRVKSCAPAAEINVNTTIENNTAGTRARQACLDFNMRNLGSSSFDSQRNAKAARRSNAESYSTAFRAVISPLRLMERTNPVDVRRRTPGLANFAVVLTGTVAITDVDAVAPKGRHCDHFGPVPGFRADDKVAVLRLD
jgi:hypothetical protein